MNNKVLLMLMSTVTIGAIKAATIVSHSDETLTINQGGGFAFSELYDGVLQTTGNGIVSGTGSITFNLDQFYSLTTFNLYNDVNANDGSGINEFTLTFLNNGITVGVFSGTAPGGFNNNPDVFNFSPTSAVNAVNLNVISNHVGFASTAPNGTQVREISFVGTAVPEPSSAILLGVGGFGLLMRRKR